MPASIPDPAAEPVSCNSWVIVDPVNGRALFETYYRAQAQQAADDGREVVTAYAWLVRLNRNIREANKAA